MSITVWVLVGFLTVRAEGGPFVVDNFASREACESFKMEIEKQVKEFRGDEFFQPNIKQAYKCLAAQKTSLTK